MTIKNLIADGVGVSKELDKTLNQLAKSFESLSSATEREEAEELIKHLRKKLKSLQQTLTDVKLHYENKELDEELLTRTELAIKNRFISNPQIYYWYEENYGVRFFNLVEPAGLRVKIAEVLIEQCKKHGIEHYPKIWDEVVANLGLMDLITE